MIRHSLKFDRPVTGVALASPAGAQDLDLLMPEGVSRDPDERQVANAVVGHSKTMSPASNAEVFVDENAATLNERPDCKALLERIAEGVERLVIQTDALINTSQETSIRLATLIVKHVVGSSDSLQTDRMRKLVDTAMKRTDPIVAVYLNLADGPRLSQQLVSDAESAIEFPFEIKTDPTIESGECRIEFSAHDVISDFDSQLAEIESRLREACHAQD